MEQVKIAIATDQEKRLTNEHFGDAKQYIVYQIDKHSVKKIGIIENTTEAEKEHEHHHGDPSKAQGIGKLMKNNNIQVLVGKVFGPNIKRMLKDFIIVLVNDENSDLAAERIRQNFDKIIENMQNKENRQHINLRKI